MYIGGIPDEIIKNKYQGECKIKENEWGCDFEQIYFTEVNVSKPLYKYINNQKHRALFNAAIEGIAAPKEYMTFLSQTLFKELLEKKYCEIIALEDLNRKQVIECKDKSKMMEYLPAYINFVFNGRVYIVSINKFVDSEMGNDNYNKKFFIYESSLLDDYNQWIFGSSFLHSFISVFDYENKSIRFYSDFYIYILHHSLTIVYYIEFGILMAGLLSNFISIVIFLYYKITNQPLNIM